MEQGGRGGQRLFNGEAVYSASLTVQEFPGKSAKDGFSFRADVRSDGLLQVDGHMRDGQRWTVSVYRDLPPFLALALDRAFRGRGLVRAAVLLPWAIPTVVVALVWHEWAELLVRGRWIPVDPSFEQAPAEGPRFTIARFEDADAAGRAEAGRKVLACWSGAPDAR